MIPCGLGRRVHEHTNASGCMIIGGPLPVIIVGALWNATDKVKRIKRNTVQ
jgi:hypothetical protein